MKDNLAQLGHTILILLGSIFFVWSAYLLEEDSTYLILSPIHIVMMLFYFNIFLIRFNFKSYPILSKVVNMSIISLAGGLFVYGDIVYHGLSSNQHQHTPQLYIGYIVIDSVNTLVLIIFNYYGYRSTFLNYGKEILVLLGFQYVYILNLLSQVIPLYTEKKIALTNDFAFMFWMIFILEEAWRTLRKQERNKVVDINDTSNNIAYETTPLLHHKKSESRIIYVFNILFLVCFYVTATASMYFYVVINMLDNHNLFLLSVWDYCLLSSNICFYLWTFTTFTTRDK
jgi:hypothetical protein